MLNNEEICDIIEWRGDTGVRVGDVVLNHYSGYRDKNPYIELYSPSKRVRIIIRNNWNTNNYIDIELTGCGVERGYSYLGSVPEPAGSFVDKVLKEYREIKGKNNKKEREQVRDKEKKVFENETQKLMSGF